MSISFVARYACSAAIMAALGAQETDSVLRVTSRLVEVSVIAQDKKGDPVRDLTREDFTLTDNKQPQKISVFSPEVAEAGPPRGASITEVSPLVIANRMERPAETSTGVAVLVFDALNMRSLDDFVYGKKTLVEFLTTLEAGDHVALYSINGPQVRVIHDFTENASSLINSARRLSGPKMLDEAAVAPTLEGIGNAGGLGGGHFDQLAGLLAEASRADEAARLRLKAEWTLTALEAIARHLTGVPGRKNLIWISSGFNLNIGLSPAAFKTAETKGVNQELFNYADRTNRIARILSEAQAVVYPVDPAGVITDQIYSASTPSIQGASQIRREQNAGHMVTAGEAAAPRVAAMRLIAKQTGGLAFFNNDIAGNIRRALDDGRVAYTLGFYPSEVAWDGKYHSLEVTVQRPDVQVRTRAGYVAESISESAPEREQSLRLAVASPLEGAAIGVKVKVGSNPLEWLSQDVVVSIDPRDIRFEEREGQMRGDVDVVFAQQAEDGRLISGEKKTIEYKLTRGAYEQSLAAGLSLPEHLTIASAAFRVRIVVRDASTGAVGSVSVPVRKPGTN